MVSIFDFVENYGFNRKYKIIDKHECIELIGDGYCVIGIHEYVRRKVIEMKRENEFIVLKV